MADPTLDHLAMRALETAAALKLFDALGDGPRKVLSKLSIALAFGLRRRLIELPAQAQNLLVQYWLSYGQRFFGALSPESIEAVAANLDHPANALALNQSIDIASTTADATRQSSLAQLVARALAGDPESAQSIVSRAAIGAIERLNADHIRHLAVDVLLSLDAGIPETVLSTSLFTDEKAKLAADVVVRLIASTPLNHVEQIQPPDEHCLRLAGAVQPVTEDSSYAGARTYAERLSWATDRLLESMAQMAVVRMLSDGRSSVPSDKQVMWLAAFNDRTTEKVFRKAVHRHAWLRTKVELSGVGREVALAYWQNTARQHDAEQSSAVQVR